MVRFNHKASCKVLNFISILWNSISEAPNNEIACCNKKSQTFHYNS